jgi:RNA-splicing ligase RtcB
MAMNYGFAFRLSSYASFRPLLRECLGATSSRLVIDSPHNTIYEEDVDGETALVHRHNACRVYPASTQLGHHVFGKIGRPLLLPGTNRTCSYVCVPGEEARRSLFSACHGAGTNIKRFVSAGLSKPDVHGRTTLRYEYSGAGPMSVSQFDDRGVDDVLDILAAHDIARPVVKLRPFAVLN